MHPVVYHYVVWQSTQQSMNKQTNIIVLTFVYYSVSAKYFDPAGSSSGSFHDILLIIESCSNIDPY
jgi:hypothetical protein